MILLLHRVTRIEFDICPTEEAARNREEQLICVLNPRFDGAGKVWPRFVNVLSLLECVSFTLWRAEAIESGGIVGPLRVAEIP